MKQKIIDANKGLKMMNIKGKNYIPVNERIKAFRREFPDGCISTEIIDHGADYNYVVVKTTVSIGGVIYATGFAHEEKGFSAVNRTSILENAETSAIGRALGVLGIGIDDSVASSDEVAQAIKKQDTPTTNRDRLAAFCRRRDISMNEVAERFGLDRKSKEIDFADALGTLMAEVEKLGG